jgi:arginyl-tRNA synthetase
MRNRLHAILTATIDNCVERGLLSRASIPAYVIEIPNNSVHGHFATNVSMVLASSQRRRPTDIAKTIIDNLKDDQRLLESAEIAGPGGGGGGGGGLRGGGWCNNWSQRRG